MLVRPEDVVDAQADLLHRLQQPGSILTQFIASVVSMQIYNEEEDKLHPDAVMKLLVPGLRVAYPYHVTRDMAKLVQYAASQLEETDRFDRTLAPTQAGFAYFEGGLPIKEVRGRTELIHWMVWNPAQVMTNALTGKTESTTAVWLFNDSNEPDQVTSTFPEGDAVWAHEKLGRWSFMSLHPLFEDQRMGPPMVPSEDEEQRARLLEAGIVDPQATNVLRLVHAFWLLLNQKVTVVNAHRLPRHAAKRAERLSLKSSVTVVKLRTLVYPEREDGHSTVNWTCRFIVRGHWRWQVYGPGKTLRKRIWVHPFIKGDPDLPLKAGGIVYGLHR
jgi:hypothetical protein